jgi:hypothetical protein
MYYYHSSVIITEPVKQYTDAETVREYKKLHQQLDDRGMKPTLQI